MAPLSLRIRLSILFIVVVTATLAIFGVYGHRQLVGELDDNFALTQSSTARRIAQSVATPLWEVNAEATGSILKAELASGDIVAINVLDLSGQLFAAMERDNSGNFIEGKQREFGGNLVFSGPLFRTDSPSERLGQLVIQFTRDKLDGTIQRNAQRLVFQIVAIDVVLTLFLLVSLRIVFRPLRHLRDALMNLARLERSTEGEISELRESKDREIAEVERGFNLTLRKIREQAQRQETVFANKAKAGELSRLLQSADDYETFGTQLLQFLSPWLRAEVGAFFVKGEGGWFRCVAGYGVALSNCRAFRSGEFLSGEAVANQRVVILRDVPENFLRIESGTISAAPRIIAAVPIIANAGVIAVFEFGCLQESAHHDAILAEALPVVTFSLELLMSRQTTLKELQERTEIEERSGMILGAVSDGIVELDNEGRIVFVNPSAPVLLGFTREEFLGQRMHALVHYRHPDGSDFPLETCPMFLTAQDGKPRTKDNEVLWRKDGSAVPVQYTTTPVYKDDALVGTVIVYRDITKRKEAEKDLADQRAAMQNILDHSPVGIAFTSQGVFGYVNPEFAELFDSRVGDAVEKIYPTSEDRSQLIEAIKRDGFVRHREMRLVAKGGQLRDFLASFVPFTHEGKEGVMGWVLDITERKQAQFAVQESKQTLEIAPERNSTPSITTIDRSGGSKSM